MPPPPLPPRQAQYRVNSQSSFASSSSPDASSFPRPRADTLHLTPYYRSPSPSPSSSSDNFDEPPPDYTEQWAGGDPRSSSMHSLRPIESAGETRRTLLLIYIHGFMGNETSFRSFPAHVHNLLTVTLAKSHVVHTKIYPRYKSRRSMDIARDDFSNWLCPNESPTTDVILVGHSLGGILAAEVALLPAHSPKSSEIYQLRILGILAFDTPFLGMHPGVVSTGLRSLFRPTPDMPPGTTQYENHLSPYPSNAESVTIANDSTVSDPFQAHSCDPNYNPSFANDIIMKNQKCWQSTLHFIHKYQNGLTKATKDYVTSYFEFGGCLADYPGLHNRYMHIRALEDVDELAQRKDEKGRFLRRVRFVNYYTACTGVSKRPGANKSPERPLETEMQHLSLDKSRSTSVAMRGDSTLVVGPRLSLEEHTDDEVIPKLLEHMDPTPMEDKDQHNDDLVEPDQTSTSTSEHPNTENLVTTDQSHEFSEDGNQEVEDDGLPPIPKLPSRPLDFDPSKYPAQDTLKLAQKEHARRVKSYERAKRDRERTIRDREKMVKKREKAALKQQEKEAKVAKKQHDMESKEKLKRRATLNPEVYDKDLERVIEEAKRSDQPLPKKKKDRKFCSLPPKDPATGERDTTWVRVYMEGMDEVVAHTSLFFGGETYEKLVGDTAGRIEEWVKEDATTRMMLQEMKSSPR